MARRRSIPRFDLETFTACVKLLRAGLRSLEDGHFGNQPQHAPDIAHYSKAVAIYLGHFDRTKVLKIRDSILGKGGKLYNLRKQSELAELRCQVAERLIKGK